VPIEQPQIAFAAHWLLANGGQLIDGILFWIDEITH
jgi:hypothetical protein